MNHALTSTIVEGYGEVSAVPVLLRRIAAELAPETRLELPRPYRVSRDGLLAPHALERAVAAVSEQGGQASGVLVLLDADDACPAELGPELMARVHAARSDRARLRGAGQPGVRGMVPGSSAVAQRQTWPGRGAHTTQGRRAATRLQGLAERAPGGRARLQADQRPGGSRRHFRPADGSQALVVVRQAVAGHGTAAAGDGMTGGAWQDSWMGQ